MPAVAYALASHRHSKHTLAVGDEINVPGCATSFAFLTSHRRWKAQTGSTSVIAKSIM